MVELQTCIANEKENIAIPCTDNVKGVKGMPEARRIAIYHLYTLFGSPYPTDEDVFKDVRIQIMKRLEITKNSVNCVNEVMFSIHKHIEHNLPMTMTP